MLESNEVIIAVAIGLAIAVPGWLLSYALYRRSRRVKEPSWAIRSHNLIRGQGTRWPNLSVLYRDAAVENLTLSRVLFWNRGAETINQDDMAPGDPLRIETANDAAMLEASIFQTNNAPSQFEVEADRGGQVAKLSFDYLDRNHGAVLQIIHSGTSSDDLKVRGAIKGSGSPEEREVTFYTLEGPRWLLGSARHPIRRKLAVARPFVFSAVVVGFLGFLLYEAYRQGSQSGSVDGGSLVVILILS